MNELRALRARLEELRGIASDLTDTQSLRDLDAAEQLIDNAAGLIACAESALVGNTSGKGGAQ